ncbi:hypothetical protein [Streptomyces megasporus]|uniref:hypothetical protein n=1 Tax=Streptomyces megasporus TaxID=44060 RepID=UPI0004E0F063|nr:hypothetical protein [Streptomyces megasporus]
MKIKSLEELCAADELTLAFNPFGFGGRLTPESAAEFQQEQIADCDLAPQVADGTRRRFDRLRGAYALGVLDYYQYTLVDGHAMLMLERALRDRFMEYCAGTLTFVNRDGVTRTVTVDTYDDVLAIAKTATNRREKLQVDSCGAVAFNGMLASLLAWARRAGLLHGQRNRRLEQTLARMRNEIAHGNSSTTSPVEAARTLHDLAEIINRLWGIPTPGGRLYPTPIPRDVIAVSWHPSGRISITRADNLHTGPSGNDDGEYLLLRAVHQIGRHEDRYLFEFDARFETTLYPADLLWGPGSRQQAAAWLEEHQPSSDTCDHLDRVLLVRHHDGHTYPPMRPQVAAGLDHSERAGTWYTLRADYPTDAFGHARSHVSRSPGHQARGDCEACHAHTLVIGNHAQALEAAARALGPITATTPPPVRVPFSLHWPRRP